MVKSFINAYNYPKEHKKGPTFIVEGKLSDFVDGERFTIIDESEDFIEINGLISNPYLLAKIYKRINIERRPIAILQAWWRRNIDQFNLTGEWIRNSEDLCEN